MQSQSPQSLPVAPDLSHINLRTQAVPVLYVMLCPSALLDRVESYAEASGDTTLIGLEALEESGLLSSNPQLNAIVTAAKQSGFHTAIPNSERFCAISAISRNIKNHRPQLL